MPHGSRTASSHKNYGWNANSRRKNTVLVLSRKTGERLHVGDNVIIEVRRIAGNRVTIAIDAPRTLRILRGELVLAAEEFEKSSGATALINVPEAKRTPLSESVGEAALFVEPHPITHPTVNASGEVSSS
ncbi:carbon storage regulator [Pirellulales bacterium]|nr:carbon storage regulator [Pirellulales bacterium]